MYKVKKTKLMTCEKKAVIKHSIAGMLQNCVQRNVFVYLTRSMFFGDFKLSEAAIVIF